MRKQSPSYFVIVLIWIGVGLALLLINLVLKDINIPIVFSPYGWVIYSLLLTFVYRKKWRKNNPETALYLKSVCFRISYTYTSPVS